jgi:phage head maturation protease
VHGTAQFIDTEVGRDHAEAVLSGAQRGISVGFISRERDSSSGRLVHTKALLLEISIVAVGANPNALVLQYVHGRLSEHSQHAGDAKHADEWSSMLRELRADLDALSKRVDARTTAEADQLAALARELRSASASA